MKFPAHSVIKLKSGQELIGDSEIWSVSANLSDDYVVGKFKDLAGRVLPPDHLDRAVQKVFELDRQPTVAEVIRSVCI
jgi:hypothetical protein